MLYKARPVTLISYFACSVLFVLSFFHFFCDLRLRGFYTDKILAWVWLFFTVLVIVKFWKKSLAKIYLCCLSLLLLGSILAMMIPFFALLFHFTTMGVRSHGDLERGYRYEWKQDGALSYPRIYIYRPKYFIFDENVGRPRYRDIATEVKGNKYGSPDYQLSDDLPLQSVHLVRVDARNLWIKFKIDNDEKTVKISMFQDEGY